MVASSVAFLIRRSKVEGDLWLRQPNINLHIHGNASCTFHIVEAGRHYYLHFYSVDHILEFCCGLDGSFVFQIWKQCLLDVGSWLSSVTEDHG